MTQRQPETIEARALGVGAGIALAIAALHAMPLRGTHCVRADCKARPSQPTNPSEQPSLRLAALPARTEDDPSGSQLAALPVAEARREPGSDPASAAIGPAPAHVLSRDRFLAAAPKRGPPSPDRG